MEKCKLLRPELLTIGGRHTGGSQMWFHDSWKRTSGCGPTTASGILWYLARARKIPALCEECEADQAHFLRFMDTVFDHVTPGMIGVHSTGIFAKGVQRFGKNCGINLKTNALKIPPKLLNRIKPETLRDFILKSLRNDVPVAFLNRSNGSLMNIGSWHWVMIVALEPDSMTATIFDHGVTKEIGLGEWLKTTALGGGFVSVSV